METKSKSSAAQAARSALFAEARFFSATWLRMRRNASTGSFFGSIAFAPNGTLFMQNITLWWACPWTLSVAAVQAGGLGMVAIGLTLMLAARVSPTHPVADGSAALWLCIVGLLGVFAVGYPGDFVFDAIWPSYYYSPVAAGKNAWLLGQALFIALYFVGLLIAFNDVRHALALATRPAHSALI